MLSQVLGAAWGKSGPELGQLAGSVAFCGVLPRRGDGEGVASGVLYDYSREKGRISSQVWMGCLDGSV
jgi:hypothetical protein